MASSKTCLSSFCVNAEHSRYFTLDTSFAICKPYAVVIGAIFFSFNFSTVSLSSRKSTFVPTRIIGVFGQWWLTSGYHFARTFSYDAGLVSEKQIKKTSYEKCNSAFTCIKRYVRPTTGSFPNFVSDINAFSTNVPLMQKPGSWFLLSKCLKNTCRWVRF